MKLQGNNFLGLLIILLGIFFILMKFLNTPNPISSLLLVLIIVLTLVLFLKNIVNGTNTDTNIILCHRTVEVKNSHTTYNLILSDGVIDLSKVDFMGSIRKIKINSLFSHCTVILSPQIPIVLTGSSALGCIHLPDSTSIFFGTKILKLGNFSNSRFHLEVEANSVFGTIYFASLIDPPKASNSELV